MRPGPQLFSLSFALLAACGSEAPAPVAPPPPPPPSLPSAAPVASVASAPTAAPTVLTDDQRARDRALAPKIEAILDAYGNFGASLSRDGKQVLFSSNREGIPELYLGDVARPADPPRKIVGGPERVASAVFSRDGKHILYRSDKGADENYHVHRCDADGKNAVDLTPVGGIHRDDVILPRRRTDTFFYTGHTATSVESKLYAQAIAGGEPREVYTDPAPAFAVDASPDGKHVLVVRLVSNSDQVVLDVDVETGHAARVFPAEGKHTDVQAAVFSADGARILVATDEGSQSNFILALDAKTHAEKTRFEQKDPKTARVDTLEVSPRGDLLAVSIDAGDHTEVRIHDAVTLAEKRRAKAALGTAEVGPFADDGKSFTMLHSLPDTPTDIYRVDAATGAVTPLRRDERRGLASLPALSTTLTAVQAFDGLSIPVIVSLPRDLPPGKKLPVIAEFHGGPAASASVGWDFFTRALTSQGFAVVQPNIRGSSGFGRAYEMADDREKRGDALRDVATVNAWIKAQPWADPERVVLFGGSYGGYLVLMGLTRQPTLWRAGVDMVGIANLFTFLQSTDPMIRAAFVDEFGDLDKDRKLLEEYSPLRDLDKIVAPLFVYQGENDPRVPRAESDQAVSGLRARKIPVEYMIAADEGHSIDRRENRVELLTRSIRFLQDEMKLPR